MKSRLETILLVKQGEIGRLKAGEISRSLKKKMLENPEFLAAVEKRMQEKAKHAVHEQATEES